MSSPLAVAKGFLTAFAAKDLEKFATYLGNPFRFKGPMMEFDSAEAFIGMIKEIAQAWQCEHKIIREIERGEDAVLIYDLVMTAPIAQTATMIEWYRVKDAKIIDIRLMFDTATLQMPSEPS